MSHQNKTASKSLSNKSYELRINLSTDDCVCRVTSVFEKNFHGGKQRNKSLKVSCVIQCSYSNLLFIRFLIRQLYNWCCVAKLVTARTNHLLLVTIKQWTLNNWLGYVAWPKYVCHCTVYSTETWLARQGSSLFYINKGTFKFPSFCIV